MEDRDHGLWSVDDLAKLFGVTYRTAYKYVVYDKRVPYRLKRIGRKALPLVTPADAMTLLDQLRPVFGTGSPLDALFIREQESKRRAGKLSGRWANHVKAKPKP